MSANVDNLVRLTNRFWITVVALLTSVGLQLGCRDRKVDPAPPHASALPRTSSTAPGAPARRPPESGGWKDLKLPRMGLWISAPADAEMEEYQESVLGADVVSKSTELHVRLSIADATQGTYAAEVKRQEQHREYKFVRWITKEKTPGGFFLRCEQTEWLERLRKQHTHHTVLIGVTVGTRQVLCWARCWEATKVPDVIRACRSIRPVIP